MSEYTVVRGGPDWFSRWMAIGSLAIAGAALFYAYRLQPAQLAGTPDAGGNLESNRNVEPGSDATDSTHFTRRIPTDSAAGSPDETNRGMAAKEDREPINWDAPHTDVDELLAEAGRTQPDAESTASGVDANNDANNDIDELFDTPIEKPTSPEPRLAVVRTSFRPNGQPESVTAVITNAGDGDARVSELVFQPDQVMELSAEASRPQWQSTDPNHLVVYFGQHDNLTKNKGKHGAYRHDLAEPFTLDAGDSLDLNVAIRNPDHKGYGLRGRLTLRLDNGEDFEVEDVTLAFVE